MRNRRKTWILVIDKTRAKIFEFATINEIPTELFEINNPEGYLKEQDLASDKPGRVMQDPFKRRTTLPPHHKKTEQVTIRFIDKILTELVALKRERRFDDLILVAAPRLLGKFRDSLANHKDLHVVKEIHRDLHNTPANSLAAELQEYLHPEQEGGIR